MIIADEGAGMQVGGILMDIFCREIIESPEEIYRALHDFRTARSVAYREKVLKDLKIVIESTDYSYAEKAAFYVCDHCDEGEVHAEGVFRRAWPLLTDDPYPEHPAALQMDVMIIENEIYCSSLRGLLVCCFNREANKDRLAKQKGTGRFAVVGGSMGFNSHRPKTNKRYANLLRQVLLDPRHTFVEKAKFFIRDYYQDGEEAAREIFKRIFATLFPREPNPLA